jgi:peptidoglycan/LPS O-acetylase OafA/YrhL
MPPRGHVHVLGFALAPSSPGARWLSRPFLVALGEASYSVYILQAVVFWFFLFPKGLYGSADMRFAVSSRAAVIVGIIVLALLSHRYVELPLRRRIRQFATRTKRPEPVMENKVAESNA